MISNKTFQRRVGILLNPPSLGMLSETIENVYPWSKFLYRAVPPYTVKQVLKKLHSFKYFEVNNILSQTNEKTDLVAILFPMLPEQMLTERKEVVWGKILEAVDIAARLGVKLMTLGSFTSIVTNQGADIIKKSPIPLTSGNIYTASLCIRAVEKASGILGVDLSKAHLTIVGATGNIGSTCAKYFASRVPKLTLCSSRISLNDPFVDSLKAEIRGGLEIGRDNAKAVADADIVIIATSSLGAIFSGSNFKKGAIVCDLSIPPNIRGDVHKMREDLLVFEGGRSRMFGYEAIDNRRWKSLFPENSIFGCLAESLILSFEDRLESYSLGRFAFSEDKVDEIYRLGIKHGYDFSDFRCFGYKYTQVDIERIKEMRD